MVLAQGVARLGVNFHGNAKFETGCLQADVETASAGE